MIKVKRFEDLIAWKKASDLTKDIYKITRTGNFAKDFALTGQSQRAAISIMSNIAEGFDRGSSKEFSQYLTIAKASCAEVRSQLYIALDIGYIDQSKFNQLMEIADEVARIVGGLRVSVNKKRHSK